MHFLPLKLFHLYALHLSLSERRGGEERRLEKRVDGLEDEVEERHGDEPSERRTEETGKRTKNKRDAG